MSESSIAVYMSSNDRIVFMVFRKESLCSLFLIAAPHRVHVEMETNATDAKVTAKKVR